MTKTNITNLHEKLTQIDCAQIKPTVEWFLFDPNSKEAQQAMMNVIKYQCFEKPVSVYKSLHDIIKTTLEENGSSLQLLHDFDNVCKNEYSNSLLGILWSE